MNTTVTEIQHQVEEITGLILQGIQCWYDAGRKLCVLMDEDPEVIDRICADVPSLTPNILRQIERIGRKQLVPELLLKSGPGWNRLRALPFDLQEKHIAAPVELLIETANGPDTLKVAVENLTVQQARQVFSQDGVRDLPAQRAYLAAHQPTRPEPMESRCPYEVHGRVVVVTKPCKLSIRELGVILAEMKA